MLGRAELDVGLGRVDFLHARPSAFEACKIGNAHFQVKVAIWDGKAVGVDLTTKPKNPKLEQCVKDQIKMVTWKQSVKSLNTVEYQF